MGASGSVAAMMAGLTDQDLDRWGLQVDVLAMASAGGGGGATTTGSWVR